MSDENEKIWFVYGTDTVTGPFTDLQIRLHLKAGKLNAADLVWCRGNREWQKLSDWKGPPPEPSSDRGAEYYVMVNGINSGPFYHVDVVEKLQSREFPLTTNVWTQGMSHWTSIYETPSIVTDIGLARRKHLRVPFVGNVQLNLGTLTHLAICISLSEGGIAIKTMDGLEVGQEFTLQIESPMLNYSVYAKAMVMYRKKEEMGLQFSQLSVEARSSIIEYVRRFDQPEEKNVFKKVMY